MFPTAERPARILVVDDDAAMRELLAARLGLAGYEVFKARNGVEGLEAFQYMPDVLILDINMPGLDGFDVLQQLRAAGRLKKTRVMVLTARNQPADVRRAIELGAHDFLAKPFDGPTLLARTARLMRRTARPTSAVQPAAPLSSAPASSTPPDEDTFMLD